MSVRSDRLHELVDPAAPLERIASGFLFTEAPIWMAYGSLHFSDIAMAFASLRPRMPAYKSGSDGTRTRDLRRDRPVRRNRLRPALTRNYGLEQAFRVSSKRLWPAMSGYHPVQPV